ncbi:hypothetical protein TSOC_006436 [Tetrabaena socialis]|uniref:Ankyrin repeat domain-containing protein n=1 Tax=Tetrabaena socialis TaxID=47790 RepID=A0A2J8A3N2_9CHLO|nr:hypothetical protein TSOC_006436 [Tetrabaena socialis]|eukprot:PNH07139.1 hypothetical protein TSOC_006436 [Tetrabaena socialis]
MAPLDGASDPTCTHPAPANCTFPTAEPACLRPPSASTASATLAPTPGLLSLPHRLLQVILAIIPGGSPGAQGGAPCACTALCAAWMDGVVGRARSAVASLLAEDGAQALADSLYDRPQLLLPGLTAAPDAGGGVRPWLLRWAAMELAAHGGRPLPKQAARLLTLGVARHDVALVRAVLRWSGPPKDLLAGDELAGHLLVAAGAGGGAAMLRALLDAGVGAQPERNCALARAVRAGDPEAARLLLAAGADATVALRRAVEQDSVEGIRLLARLGVSFAAQGGNLLLRRAARQGSPLVVGALLRGGRWEYETVCCALAAALEANRVQSAGLLRGWLARVEPHHLRAAFRWWSYSWAEAVEGLRDTLPSEAGRAEDVAGLLLVVGYAITSAILFLVFLFLVLLAVLDAWVDHRRRVRVPLGEAPVPGD